MEDDTEGLLSSPGKCYKLWFGRQFTWTEPYPGHTNGHSNGNNMYLPKSQGIARHKGASLQCAVQTSRRAIHLFDFLHCTALFGYNPKSGFWSTARIGGEGLFVIGDVLTENCGVQCFALRSQTISTQVCSWSRWQPLPAEVALLDGTASGSCHCFTPYII